MKMTKKWVLWASGMGGGLLVFLLLALIYGFCGSYRQMCKDVYTPLAYLCFSFPILFVFSLITYKMRDKVFHAWWVFARWWVPVIIFVTLLLNSAGGGGGYVGMGAAFDGFIYLILYGVLIIVSLVKIVRAHKKK